MVIRFLNLIALVVVTVIVTILPAGNTAAYDEKVFADIEQPVKFSHKTHAKTNQISCEYCHSDARKSRHSGVPPVRTCMGCHAVIKGETEAQKQEIAKVVTYWEKQEPIPWKKIHDLPDHARFSHKRHLGAGFDCTSCHGDISERDDAPVPQPARGNDPLTMGWCMSCHRTEQPIGENGKIALPVRKTRGGPIIGEAPASVGAILGNTDCLTCHQ